jgi:hypothetical protein
MVFKVNLRSNILLVEPRNNDIVTPSVVVNERMAGDDLTQQEEHLGIDARNWWDRARAT